MTSAVAMRRFRRVSIPQKAHPLVRDLYAAMRDELITTAWLADRSGVSARTIESWRTSRAPILANVEACLNVLGYRLAALPASDQAWSTVTVVPPEWGLSRQEGEFAEILLTAHARKLHVDAVCERMEIERNHLHVVVHNVRRKLERHGWTIAWDHQRYHIRQGEAG